MEKLNLLKSFLDQEFARRMSFCVIFPIILNYPKRFCRLSINDNLEVSKMF